MEKKSGCWGGGRVGRKGLASSTISKKGALSGNSRIFASCFRGPQRGNRDVSWDITQKTSCLSEMGGET